MSQSEITIGQISDFPENQGVPVNVNGIQIAVFNDEGELYAIQNNCPHQNLPLHNMEGDWKYNEENRIYKSSTGDCTIKCPWHMLEIDLKTGQTAHSYRKIQTYDVHTDDSGNVILCL